MILLFFYLLLIFIEFCYIKRAKSNFYRNTLFTEVKFFVYSKKKRAALCRLIYFLGWDTNINTTPTQHKPSELQKYFTVMDPTPTHRCTVQRPFFLLHPTHHHHHHHICHHHHHHFLCFCPQHHHHHHHFKGHPHLCPTLISPFPRNPEASNPVTLPNRSNLETSASGCEQAFATANQ